MQALYWLALLLLCAAYVQGGLVKAFGFRAAVDEMARFGLQPAAPLAAGVIVLELGAPVLILSGVWRWAGALALAAFTLAATLVALRFWDRPPGQRFVSANAFFEHLGLVGGFLLVAWLDWAGRAHG